ncbi:MAG: exodeoxyribonuclease III [Proteobacteria bacterium]|nr:exodeoxyribonuclease III [Pseudomonadota bacterium]
MRFVSFNANGIRARLHQIDAINQQHRPDVIALQETKVADEVFPFDEVRNLGFTDIQIFGQKGHYGVALLAKRPAQTVQLGLPWREHDQQRRFISATYQYGDESIRVINCYFPQGESRDHPTKFADKEQFYSDVATYLREHCSAQAPVIVAGDMNVAPQDLDIGIGEDNQKRWLRTGKTSFLPEEREWLARLTDWGLNDCYLETLNGGERLHSWFDYRSRGFERSPKRGLRIDMILATATLASRLTDAGIDHEIRSQEKPSDHCPLWSNFDL